MPLAAETVARTEHAASRTPDHRNYPIAIHLALFATGILAPVLLIVTWMVIDTARLRRDDALHSANIVVRQLSAALEVEIENSIAVSQTLATSLAFAEDDHTAFDSQARDVAQRLGLVIAARDRSGQQILNTAVERGLPLPKSNETIIAVDRLAAERGAPVVSDLVAGTVLRTPFVIMDVPVLKGGQVVFFIDATLFPRRIADILSRGLPEGWIAGVVGGDGRLISRSFDQDRYVGTSNFAFLRSATDQSGVFAGTSREGAAIEGAYIRSPLSGWVISVAVPETALRAPARFAMVWLGGLVAASLAVSSWLGWRLSRRIASPIRNLVAQARELGEGRRPAVVPSRVDEVNAVTEALRAASVELESRAAAARQAADAVRANEERLQLVQDTAGIGTIDWDIAADRVICSPRFYELFSRPVGSSMTFAGFLTRVHPEERPRVEAFYNRLRQTGGPFEHEFRILTPDGEERWIYSKGRLDLKDGKPARLFGASIDITERKRSEEHLRFLLRELSHRSKNLLAVIQAMASQTAKSAETVDVFRRRFGERLMGLAASHDLLVNQNWLGASVGSLVRGQLSPFFDSEDPRLRLSGPDVDLKAEAAEALGLALHELATNSVKYGALKDLAGRVEIVWEVYEPADPGDQGPDAAPAPDGRRFRMDWIEHAVERVTQPSHKGFGRMVIEHTVEARLGGIVTLTFPPEGLRWRVDAPASCLASARGRVA